MLPKWPWYVPTSLAKAMGSVILVSTRNQQMRAQPYIAVLALAASGALSSGCDKKGPESVQAGTPKEVVTTPAPPSRPPPEANAKSIESPPPGQANDHSNPEFKGGGAPDKSGKNVPK